LGRGDEGIPEVRVLQPTQWVMGGLRRDWIFLLLQSFSGRVLSRSQKEDTGGAEHEGRVG
jgi:hypothetical protein